MSPICAFTIVLLTLLLPEISKPCRTAAFPKSKALHAQQQARNVVRSNYVQDLFLITEEDTVAESQACDNCTEGERLYSSPFNSKLVEKVKARILTNLHMKEVPKNKSIPKLHSLTFPGWEQVAKPWSAFNNDSEEEVESETLFSQVSAAKCTHDGNETCIRFQIKLSKHMKPDIVRSAELWLFKKRDVTSLHFTQHVFDFAQGALKTGAADPVEQARGRGWVRFDATTMLETMFSSSDRILDLEISSNCSAWPLETADARRPFLVVHVSESRRVSKRSVKDCDGEENVTCCRERFYVKFKDIGWDSWIVEPKGYWANFCRGSCRLEANFAKDHHSTVMILLMANHASEARRAGITVNCVPKSLRSTPVIHASNTARADGVEEDDVHEVEVNMHVPNMSVEECACA